jgi:hypothetical protein
MLLVRTSVIGTALLALFMGKADAQPAAPRDSTVVHLSATVRSRRPG